MDATRALAIVKKLALETPVAYEEGERYCVFCYARAVDGQVLKHDWECVWSEARRYIALLERLGHI